LSTRGSTAPRVSPASLRDDHGSYSGATLHTRIVIEVITKVPNGTTITVHVVPGSKSFAIAGTDEWTDDIKIKLKNKANGGKANQELVSELGKILSAEVKIISGHKSRRKKLLIASDVISVKKLIR